MVDNPIMQKISPRNLGMDLSMESMTAFVRPTEVNNNNISRIT
jgi:hypothetical protein